MKDIFEQVEKNIDNLVANNVDWAAGATVEQLRAASPINYVCDFMIDENGGYYKAVHRMPFCSKDHDDSDWIEYGHTMEEYLGGLLACDFVINGYMECQMDDITELYFMTRAIKG